MKKIFLFTAILFASITMASAQAANPTNQGVKSGSVILQINLHAFQSIEIGGDQEGNLDSGDGLVGGVVVLNYNTAEKYEDGVKRTINNHIKIWSAGGYVVKVKTSGDNLTNNNNEKNIPVSTIKLSAEQKSGEKATIKNNMGLSTTGVDFISSKNGTYKEVSFDVTYTGDKNNSYGQYVNKSGEINYLTTTVTYTISPQ